MARQREVIVYQVTVECKKHAGHQVMISGDDHFVDIVAALLRDYLPWEGVQTLRLEVDRDSLMDELPF